jgi:hypothetical protein
MENNAAEVLLVKRRQDAQERNSTGDIRQYRGVYRTRLILRILSLATCVTIVGLIANSIRLYIQTKHVRHAFQDGSGTFPVWPEGLKLYPSYLLSGAALAAGLFSLLLIVASFHKNVRVACKYIGTMLTDGQIRRMTKTGNVTTIIVTFACLVIWVVVTAYYGSWDTEKTNWDLM